MGVEFTYSNTSVVVGRGAAHIGVCVAEGRASACLFVCLVRYCRLSRLLYAVARSFCRLFSVCLLVWSAGPSPSVVDSTPSCCPSLRFFLRHVVYFSSFVCACALWFVVCALCVCLAHLCAFAEALSVLARVCCCCFSLRWVHTPPMNKPIIPFYT